MNISHLRRRHDYRVGQALRIHGDMPFDTGQFFARPIALAADAVDVLDALGVNDATVRLCVAPLLLSNHANLVFLMFVPADCRSGLAFHSAK